jgi:hypothetical protein
MFNIKNCFSTIIKLFTKNLPKKEIFSALYFDIGGRKKIGIKLNFHHNLILFQKKKCIIKK